MTWCFALWYNVVKKKETMDRKLATIERINTIRPIENADAIEVATVRGWHVVVKKDEFKVGDLCVYCEIDSVLPDREEFEFLRDRKFRIKTIKLRGQVSQGICFPLDILPEGYEATLGDDITELLGIIKYEPLIHASLSGKVKGSFPAFLEKTDEERIQNCVSILQHPDANKPMWYVTEKLDGTSCTSYYREGTFGVCSRNLDLDLSDSSNTYVQVAGKLDLAEKLKSIGRDMAIQGEIIGPGIQKNRYGLKDHELRVFNIFDINKYKRIQFYDFLHIVDFLELDTVPIIDSNFVLPDTVDDLVEYSNAPSVFQTPKFREGVVIRHKLDGTSFKVLNPNFLLKYED